MSRIMTIAWFTMHEIFGFRVARTLVVMTMLLPVFAWIFSQLFMLEVLKVQIDVMTAGAYAGGVLFVLVVVVPLLGNDIGNRVCYFYLPPPMDRDIYLLGRFIGCALALLAMFSLFLLLSLALIQWGMHTQDEVRRHGIGLDTGLLLAWTAYYQTLSLLAAVFLVCAFATGLAEMLVFSSCAALAFWAFPPVLQALQSQEIQEDVPASVMQLIHGVQWLLPDMSGGAIVLASEHGIELSASQLLLHAGGHIGYAIAMLASSLLLFRRRDL